VRQTAILVLGFGHGGSWLKASWAHRLQAYVPIVSSARKLRGGPASLRSLISFCHCRVELKRARIRRVKYWQISLAILAALSASIALAEDFKTIRGKLYKDATIIRVESDGIVLKTKTGISKVYFIELPKDVRERFHPSPAKTPAAQRQRAAAPRQREPIKLEGWAAVMANRTAVVMFFVAGAIIIAGVVFAIVRRRFQ
jgi:hypothetical protein